MSRESSLQTQARAGAPPFRVGLLVPSSNTVMENDLHRGLSRERYTIHTARMFLVETTREGEIEMLEQHAPKAALDVGTARPGLLVFGCTSAGSLFGLEHDRKVCGDLGRLAGCPSLGTASAASEAIARRGLRRIALITPYNESLTQAVADTLRAGGPEIVQAHGMGITDNVALADPTPEDIVAFTLERLSGASMDGVFVSCTNFRALEAREELERRLGVPVLTSNFAVIEGVERFAAAMLQAPLVGQAARAR